jgi:hypothetical protein
MCSALQCNALQDSDYYDCLVKWETWLKNANSRAFALTFILASIKIFLVCVWFCVPKLSNNRSPIMRSTLNTLAMACLSLGLLTGESLAGVVSYIGEDLQFTANPTVRTNSDAAAANFIAAASGLGSVAAINFEASPLGSFSNLAVAPGVTMSGTDFGGNQQTIRNTTNFPSYPSVDGSNTTIGGSRFVEMQGGTLVFTFAQPTQFFGAYVTGVQTNFFADTISFSDGSSQSITLAGAGTSRFVGETAFVGFTDAGKSITSVTITASDSVGADFIGVDDVMYQAASVPEPSSLVMFGLAGFTMGCYARARGRRMTPGVR